MKFLTYSQTGVIIELNSSEFLEFKHLIQAVEDKTVDETINPMMTDYHRDLSYLPDLDMQSVFGVIRAFYLQKFRVNEIRRGLDILEDALKKEI